MTVSEPRWARLFVEDFIEIHEFVGDHRPGGQLRSRNFVVVFRFAVGDEFTGVVGRLCVMLLELFERAADDGEFCRC